LPSLVVVQCGRVGRRRYRTREDIPARFAARAVTSLLESAWRVFHAHYGLLATLVVAQWGENGPAQIRTAVTATRRPKDTKLPHRPASRSSPLGFLTLPNGRQPGWGPPFRSRDHGSKYRSRCRRHPGLNSAPHSGHASSSGFARLPEGLRPSLSPSRYARADSVAPQTPHSTAGSSNRDRGHGSGSWSAVSA